MWWALVAAAPPVAHRGPPPVVDNPVNVMRPKGSPLTRPVQLLSALTVGRVLGEFAADDDERAARATVIVPIGALAGKPAQQPHLKFVFGAGQAVVPPSRRIEARRERPVIGRRGIASGNGQRIGGKPDSSAHAE